MAAHAPHAHVVGVLAPPHEVLVAHVVGAVVAHEAAAVHPAGVAPAHVGGHVSAVAAAVIGAALEVPLLVEGDLETRGRGTQGWSAAENRGGQTLWGHALERSTAGVVPGPGGYPPCSVTPHFLISSRTGGSKRQRAGSSLIKSGDVNEISPL